MGVLRVLEAIVAGAVAEVADAVIALVADIAIDDDLTAVSPNAVLSWTTFALDDELQKLEPLLALTRMCPNARLLIEGFTDNRGTKANNADLSRRRAERVAAFIVARGIAPGLVVIEGRGNADPIATGDTRAARARNRRVEVSIVAAP